MPIQLRLFLTFARVGAFTFGGGYSMLPMFRRELVENNGWLTDAELTDYYSVSQCLPGIIAVNTATFTGYKQAGRSGGISAALGIITPSVLIILIIAAFISNFADIPAVGNAFAGIRVCVCVLITNTVIKLRKNAVADLPAFIIFAAVFLLSSFTSLPAAALVVTAGAVGLGLAAVRRRFG